MARISPFGRYRAFDENGAPLAGGKLYTYEAGTSTPKATYTTGAATVANTNPVILDADGYADVWLDVGGYKFTLNDADGNLQFTVDNIDGGNTQGFASFVTSRSSSFSAGINDQGSVIVCTTSLTVSLLSATVAGNGFSLIFVNTSSGNVTIDPDGSETINGSATLVIPPNGSATLSSDGINWFAYGVGKSQYSDSEFRVNGSADATKKLAFEVDGLTTGTTRTLTVQDKSGIIPVIETADILIPATASGPSSVTLSEDTDNGTNTVKIIAPAAVTANRTITLPDVDGTVLTTGNPTAGLMSGAVIQSVGATLNSPVSCGALLPFDNTIPQISEGVLLVSATITPTSATNILRVRAHTMGSGGAVGNVAAFISRDSTTDAVAVTAADIRATTIVANMSLEYQVVAGSTSATTFKLYGAGQNGVAGFFANANNTGTRWFGDITKTSIVVEELLA